MHGLILQNIIFAAAGLCEPDGNSLWTGEFVRYAPGDTTDECTYTGPFYGYMEPGSQMEQLAYTNFEKRQYLHFRVGNTSTGPSPVYFFAHGNGGAAPGMGMNEVTSVAGQGYAIIAWESLTNIANEQNTETCVSDFELVIQWAIDNAEQYGFDIHRFVIAGRSRGSVISWMLAQSQDSRFTVIGIYMYNALPINDEAQWQNTSLFPLVDVTINSPRTYFIYGPECPTDPPQETCDIATDLGGDIHNPMNGQRIVEAYEALGIGAKISLRQGCDCSGNGGNIAQDFPDFAPTLIPPTECDLNIEWACPDYKSGSPMACRDCVLRNKAVVMETNCNRTWLTQLCLATAGGSSANADSLAFTEMQASFSFIEDQIPIKYETSNSAHRAFMATIVATMAVAMI